MKAATTDQRIPPESIKDYLAGRHCALSELIESELEREESDVYQYVNRLRTAAANCLNPRSSWIVQDATERRDPASDGFSEGADVSPSATSQGVGTPLRDLVYEWAHTLADETEKHVTEQLAELLGAIAEQFRASSAAIYILRDKDKLQPAIRHNMPNPKTDVRVRRDKGIVPYVAYTQQGYCAPDTSRDKRYRADVLETRSELDVPIIDPTERDQRKRVLGVLNLESTEVNAFSAANVEELQAAAGVFVQHLLILQAITAHDERWLTWHPQLHGWDLSRVFQRLCHAVAQALDRDFAMCSIWYVDQPKDALYIYATSGYDTEYKSERILPMASCTGQAAMAKAGEVIVADPQVDFVRWEKAVHMGIRESFLCPIYSPQLRRRKGEIGVLSVYFRTTGNSTPLLRRAIAALADLIGGIAVSFDRLRPRIAAAQLHYLLYQMPRSSESDFEVIRDFVKEVFSADGCTIFARRPDDDKLVCVATTGLEWSSRGSVAGASGKNPCYDLKKERGYTISLAQNPGICIRMNNVLDRTEGGLPSFLPKNPLLKYRENFAPRNDENRRILAVGLEVGGAVSDVGVRNGTAKTDKMNDSLGVFRLLRRPRSRPFTLCDEHLLSVLALQTKNAFVDWQRLEEQRKTKRPTARRKSAKVSKIDSQRMVKAAARLLRPLPVGRSPAPLIDELLRDIYYCYSGFGVDHSALLIKPSTQATAQYRLHSYFSSPNPVPPEKDESREIATEDHFKQYYLPLRAQLISTGVGQLPIAIANSSSGKRRQSLDFWSGETAGVRIPVVALTRGTVIDAVLLLNFSSPIRDWADFPVEFLLLAAARLEAIWSMTSSTVYDPYASPMENLNPELARLGVAACMERCRQYIKERFGVKTRVIWESTLPNPKSWRFVTSRPGLGLFGVLQKKDSDRKFAIPLHYGPITVGYVIVDSPEKDVQVIAEVATSIWSPISFGRENSWNLYLTPSCDEKNRTCDWSYKLDWHKKALSLRGGAATGRDIPLFAKT